MVARKSFNCFCTSLGQFAIYSSIEVTLLGSMSSPISNAYSRRSRSKICTRYALC